MVRIGLQRFAIGIATVFILLLSAPAIFAQAVAVASITGQVTDPTGSGVAGATVRMVEIDKQRARGTTTDAQGRFSLPNLPVGPYQLVVNADGFRRYTQSGIVLQVNDSIQQNVQLQLGTVSENVEVQASASMVQTQDTSVSQVIDERRINDLPLNGRQATSLVLLSGAAATAPGGDMSGSKNFYSSTTISIAGGQANGTNYLLDGGDNNDTFSNVNLPFPFPDALQEFSVETSSLPARNGLHPGGAVNIVTKSGSNQWHGDLFDYLRNGDVNARNYFGTTHDSLKRNQFGGTVGGRIIKDKLFFFAGYQGTRNRQNPPSTTSFVPTPAALAGDFSTLNSATCVSSHKARTLLNPFAPAPNTPFPNNQIPTNYFNPASLKLMSYIPSTSDPCGRVTYGIPTTGDEDQWIGRIDWVRNQKHSIYGRYFVADYRNPAVWDPSNILVTTSPGNLQRAQSFTLGDTYSFGPATLNSFHATFTRRRDDRGPNPQNINVTTLGVNLAVAVPDDMRIGVANAFNVGCGTCSPGHFNVNTFQFADDVDVIRGRHSISFGVDFIRTQNNTLSGYLQNGNFNFGGLYTGDPMADFLVGLLSNNGSAYAFSQSRAQLVSMRETIPGVYAQDVIHVNSRLTINAGIRWEPMLFPTDYFGRGSAFNQQAFLNNQKSSVFTNAPAGMFYYGDPGIPKAFTNNKYTNFAPRLGIVFDPKGDGKQTIRVGGAILYDSGMVWFAQRLMSNPPYVNEIDLTTAGPFDDPWAGYPGGNPFPGVVPPPSDVTFPTQAFYAVLPPNLKSTYMSNWNASYQRQFANNWLATVSYMGNKTSHLWLTDDINPAVYIPGTCGGKPCSSTANTAQRRTLYLDNPAEGQYLGQVALADDGANANYNGMLVSVQHRFNGNFTVLANYTWSHCISEGDFNGDLRGAYYQNPYDRSADRGDCNFDIRHIFNLSGVAISPVHGNGLAGHILGNWRIAPLLRVSSGSALNITSGKDNSLTGEGLDRPNLVDGSGSAMYPSSIGPSLQWINSKAFAQNAAGTFGNLGRDTLRGPDQINLDVSLSRLFSLTERFHLEARAEGFNVINHTNFNSPNTNLNSSTFGRITSAGDPRILQFALKLHF